MARMNRDILVPYLYDVCALHLAKKKCLEQVENLKRECERVRCELGNVRRPLLMAENTGTGYSRWIAYGCVGLLPLFLFLGEMGLVLGFILLTVLCVLHLFAQSSKNEMVQKQNEVIMNRWKQEVAQHDMNINKKCEQINAEIENLKQEALTIDELLNNTYSANLIPSRYRDIYSAVYLYDWFSTGISDDIDMALNIYVLEQIKSRLDTIIRNQGEQIINQRAIIANQAQTMNMIECNAQQMRTKVARMGETLEKQNVYLKMIDSNVAATRYFAEQTYKKWY